MKYFAVYQVQGESYYRDQLKNINWRQVIKFLDNNAYGAFNTTVLKASIERNGYHLFQVKKHLPHGFFSIAAECIIVVGNMDNWHKEEIRFKETNDAEIKRLQDTYKRWETSEFKGNMNINISIGD
jgi:hypothetical protein